MNFVKYQHIQKLGTDDVDGILNGTVYLFYKIDGTNASIWLSDDGQHLCFGSRKREISIDDDNQHFAAKVTENPEVYNELLAFLQAHPSYTIYGEWLVPHTLKTYNADAWNHFYIFDVYDNAASRYLPYEEYITLIDQHLPHCHYIPLITKMDNPTAEDIEKELDHTGAFLCTEGLGEGIVIKRYDFVNKYGRVVWAKMLTEDFKSHKKEYRAQKCKEKVEIGGGNVELAIINKLLTNEHILKERAKILEDKGTEWSDRYIFELLGRVFHEFIHDNLDIILKKWHNPTINFTVLKKYSDERVKTLLNI